MPKYQIGIAALTFALCGLSLGPANGQSASVPQQASASVDAGAPGAVPGGVRERAGRAPGIGIGRNRAGAPRGARQEPDGFGLVEH